MAAGVFFVTVTSMEGLPATFVDPSRSLAKSFVPTSSAFRADPALCRRAWSAGEPVGNKPDVGDGGGETVGAGWRPEGWTNADGVAVVVGSGEADSEPEL